MKLTILKNSLSNITQRIEELKSIAISSDRLAELAPNIGEAQKSLFAKAAAESELSKILVIQKELQEKINHGNVMIEKIEEENPQFLALYNNANEHREMFVRVSQEIARLKKIEWIFGTIQKILKGSVWIISIKILFPVIKIVSIGLLAIFGGEKLINSVMNAVDFITKHV